MKSKVGTSGFGIAQQNYVKLFSCVEVQHTFYQPPRVVTLERWRALAPPDFEFVLKAWQLITHAAKSPTYRRLKKQLSEVEREEAGYFRPTSIVREAWEATLASARALNARTILFQCPASFTQSGENIANFKRFFKTISRNRGKDVSGKLNFAWEPRGDWDPKVVKKLCSELDLSHAVDPFTTQSVTPEKFYFRLHGRNGWRYEYEETELRELAGMLNRPKMSAAPTRVKSRAIPAARHQSYVFFNNARMTADALEFQAITAEAD